MAEQSDLVISGAGPAGAAAAIAAARRGLRVTLVERAVFPRHKVCGDCLNPDCWPVFEALGVADGVRGLEQGAIDDVRLVGPDGRAVSVPLPPGAETAVRREALDELLLEAARREGVMVRTGQPVTSVEREGERWVVRAGDAVLAGRVLIAADGRNSTVCRLLRLSPPARRDRVAMQTHAPLRKGWERSVSLEIFADGYCGIAPVGGGRMNVCVVARAEHIDAVRARLVRRLELPVDLAWHSIAPLEREDIDAAPLPGLFLAGDAARVVEPFTGEGIYYALRSGELAAAAAADELSGIPGAADRLRAARRVLYRRRLWVNRLTRLAVTRPAVGGALVRAGRCFPWVLRVLTAKVVRPAAA